MTIKITLAIAGLLAITFGVRHVFSQSDPRTSPAASPSLGLAEPPLHGESGALTSGTPRVERVPVTSDAETGANAVQLLAPSTSGIAIRGRVLTPDGKPASHAQVANATLDLFHPDHRPTWFQSVESDAEGHFDLLGLAAGATHVTARLAGFAASEPLLVQLPTGHDLESVDLRLRAGGTLRIEVKRADGKPAARRKLTYANEAMHIGALGTTDEKGVLEARSLEPGRWFAWTEPTVDELAAMGEKGDLEHKAFLQTARTPAIEVVDGKLSSCVLGAPLQHPIHVHGRIAAAGEWHASTMQWVQGGAGSFDVWSFAMVEHDGAFDIDLERPGSYWVGLAVDPHLGQPTSAQALVTVPDVRTFEHDLTLPSGAIRGCVRNFQVCVGRVFVALHEERCSTRLPDACTDGRCVYLENDGSFSFNVLEPGEYSITLMPEGGNDGRSIVRKTGLVVEAGRELDGIEFQLVPGACVRGTVRNAIGQLVRDAFIVIHDANGALLTPTTRIHTDASGGFVTPALQSGSYTLTARTPESSSVPIEITVGEKAPQVLAFTLRPAGQLVVSGLTVGDDPTPALCILRDAKGREFSGVRVDHQRQEFNAGYEPGLVRFTQLPPGLYTLRATLADGSSVRAEASVAEGETRRVAMR